MIYAVILYIAGFAVCYLLLSMLYKLKEGNSRNTKAKIFYSLTSWLGALQVLKEFDIECKKQDDDHNRTH